MELSNTFYTSEREKWREWLTENFEKEKEIWLVFPKKESGEKGLSYNDSVEEALCFGWIDSTVKKLDSLHRVQRFSPRRKGSGYSRANIERVIWLERQGGQRRFILRSETPFLRDQSTLRISCGYS